MTRAGMHSDTDIVSVCEARFAEGLPPLSSAQTIRGTKLEG